MKLPVSTVGAMVVSMLLVGCATVPADRGASVTTGLLQSRSALAAGVPVGSKNTDTRALVEKILAAPVDADAAVRLALLGNPRMQVLYTELGMAQAEVYDASRLPNPSLGFKRTRATGDIYKTTWSVSQSFTELLFIGYSKRVSRSQLLQAQQRVASEVLALEAEVRSAYFQYVCADLVMQMRGRSTAIASASSQHAKALFDSGNISALQLSREQAQRSETLIQQHVAVAGLKTAQGRLMTLLGLPLTQTMQWVKELPLPGALSAEVPALQNWARSQRLDLAALREQSNMFNTNLTHTRRWRWLGGVQLGYEHESETGSETFSGPGAEVALPLFNPGGGALLRARANLEASQAGVAALELDIGNDVQARYLALQSVHDIVDEYRQRLLPLRNQIVALNQQEQNFMLVGAFELLAAKREEMDAYQLYLEAVRDYWLAHTELVKAAGGSLPAGVEASDQHATIGLAIDDLATDVADSGAASDRQQAHDHAAHSADDTLPGMNHSGHDMSHGGHAGGVMP